MMTIQDKALKSFFLKQKKASIDSLLPQQIQTFQNETFKKDNAIKESLNTVLEGRDKIVNQSLAKREQSVSKALAKREQSVSKQADNHLEKLDSVSKALAEPLANPLAKREQSVSKQPSEGETDLIVGKERMLLFYLFKKCQSIGSLETSPITTDELTKLLKIKPEHIRNLVFRLNQKGLLKISKIKNGRAGWRKFILPKDTFQSLSITDNISTALANREQSVSKALSKALAEPLASTFSSSGINNNSKNTTTTNTNDNLAYAIPDSWRSVEYGLLDSVGFTQTHLSQLSRLGTLEPSIVQDSIYHFAFDLKHNNKASSIKGDPLSYFMGIVSRRGAYTAPSNYIDPALEAMNAYHKSKEQSEKQRAEIEQKVQEIEFRIWHDSLTDDEILVLLPEEILNAIGPSSLKQRLKVQHLKKHYVETLWLERRRELCKSMPNWMTTEPVKP